MTIMWLIAKKKKKKKSIDSPSFNIELDQFK